MRLMRRLTDNRRIIKLILQSLPAVLVAIALVMYGLTFLPRSVERMGRSVALIEYVSYYEIDAAGKPMAWFKAFGDSLLLEEMSLKVDTTVMNRQYINGVWVNKYGFIPSCRGLVLTTFPDSMECERLALANKNVSVLLQKTADNMKKGIERIDSETDETEYFLSIHNVNDDGYNIIAEYSAGLKDRKEKVENILSVLKGLTAKTGLSVRMIKKYTLLYRDTSGTVRRIACNVLTKDGHGPFCLLQIIGKKTPDGVKPVYLHNWFSPSVCKGEAVIIAAYPGCMESRFTPETSQSKTFSSTADSEMHHNIPPLISPDGSPIYTERGFFIGINYKGAIVKPDCFGFGLKKLRR